MWITKHFSSTNGCPIFICIVYVISDKWILNVHFDVHRYVRESVRMLQTCILSQAVTVSACLAVNLYYKPALNKSHLPAPFKVFRTYCWEKPIAVIWSHAFYWLTAPVPIIQLTLNKINLIHNRIPLLCSLPAIPRAETDNRQKEKER